MLQNYAFSCGGGVKLPMKIVGIQKAIVRSWMINKIKLSHIFSKGIPISIEFLHSRAKSDGNTDESAMSLNNSMNIIMNTQRPTLILVGRHLIRV